MQRHASAMVASKTNRSSGSIGSSSSSRIPCLAATATAAASVGGVRFISGAAKRRLKKALPQQGPSVEGTELVYNFRDYEYIRSIDAANAWAMQTMHDLNLLDSSTGTIPSDPDRSAATVFSAAHRNEPPLFLGIDVGWNRFAPKRVAAETHMLHVSLPNRPVGSFHVSAMNREYRSNNNLPLDHPRSEKTPSMTNPFLPPQPPHSTRVSFAAFPSALRYLLELPHVRAVGLDVNRDVARCKRKFGAHIPFRIELERLSLGMNPRRKKVTMAHLCREYLTRTTSTTMATTTDNDSDTDTNTDIADSDSNNDTDTTAASTTTSPVIIEPTIGQWDKADFAQDPLPVQLIQYGALEALLFRQLAETMLPLAAAISQAQQQSAANDVETNAVRVRRPNPRTHPNKKPALKQKELAEAAAKLLHNSFQIGSPVEIYLSWDDHSADGIVEYIGGAERMGESYQFGDLIIGTDRALVRLTQVYFRERYPTYGGETFRVYGADWEHDVTLQYIFESNNPIVAVNLKDLKHPTD